MGENARRAQPVGVEVADAAVVPIVFHSQKFAKIVGEIELGETPMTFLFQAWMAGNW